MKREIEKKLKSLKNTISSNFKNENICLFEQGKYRILLTLVHSQRLNTTQLKNEKPEVYKRYLMDVDYEKLTVSLLEG